MGLWETQSSLLACRRGGEIKCLWKSFSICSVILWFPYTRPYGGHIRPCKLQCTRWDSQGSLWHNCDNVLKKWQKTSWSEQNKERMREQRRKDEGTKRTGKQEWKSRVGESTSWWKKVLLKVSEGPSPWQTKRIKQQKETTVPWPQPYSYYPSFCWRD